ncbi:MAG: DUF2332 family protein [Pseudomonadota bacterium]
MSRVQEAFFEQAVPCDNLGSPFTANLCRLIGSNIDETTAVGRLCFNWPGELGPSHNSIPLRLCGGLHALVISNAAPELAAHYPPHSSDAPPWQIVVDVFVEHEPFLLDWMESPPQTNEVQRSNVLWPGLMTIAGRFGPKLRILEVGASAGLNLHMDRFAYRHGDLNYGDKDSLLRLEPEWRGTSPTAHKVDIVERGGCDINPLDISDPKDVMRLRSYLWADQLDRRERLDHAIAIAQANPVKLAKQDAVDWLEDQLSDLPTAVCTVVYSTIAWQYLPDERKQAGEAVIMNAAGRATDSSPLAWLRFEADGQTPGASIRLQTWPDGRDDVLGRGDFHGRWVDWTGA